MAKGERMLKGRWSSGKRTICTTALVTLALVSVCFLLLLGAGIVGVPSAVDSSNVPISLHLQTLDEMHRDLLKHRSSGLEEEQGPWTEIISWEPRAAIYHNFLSAEECDHLIRLARPRMRKSTVVDSFTGQSKDSRVRTSSGMFLTRGQNKVISDIEKRISKFTFIPVEHGEGIQVLHYEVGQKYEPHYDYFLDTVNTKNGGQRVATVLMYLTDVEAGGETVFPKSKVNATTLPWYNELSECAKAGLSIRPRRGDALLFWSMSPDAQLDPTSLHGGCPVIKGDKWSATKWMRVQPYNL